MEAKSILSMDILDLLFEGRNKEYGAYALRKTYQRRINRALLITFLLISFVLAGMLYANTIKPQPVARVQATEITLQQLDEEEKVIPPPVMPPAPEQPVVQSLQFASIRIVPNEEVQQPPPEQTDLADVKIDILDREGIKDIGIVTPAVIDEHKGIIEEKKGAIDEIFTKVEIEARFDGGETAWRKYLERNLNPNTPVDNEAPEGTYTVIVQFVVSREGIISDVRALTSYGYGMEQEAIRVIRKGPNWIPAVQNGNKVSAYRKQPVTFRVNAGY